MSELNKKIKALPEGELWYPHPLSGCQITEVRGADLKTLVLENEELERKCDDMKLRNHLLRDRVDLPDELYAKRMKWYDKAMKADALVLENEKLQNEVELLRKGVDHYADESNWFSPSEDADKPLPDEKYGYAPSGNGYDFARQIQAQVKGEGNE